MLGANTYTSGARLLLPSCAAIAAEMRGARFFLALLIAAAVIAAVAASGAASGVGKGKKRAHRALGEGHAGHAGHGHGHSHGHHGHVHSGNGGSAGSPAAATVSAAGSSLELHSHERSGAARLEDSEKHPATAIALTFVSGLAAAAGGLAVVCAGAPSEAAMGHMLSFASGIMLYISYADLLPHAIAGLAGEAPPGEEAGGEHAGHGHGSLAGFRDASLWMFAGMAGFLLITACLPEISLGPADDDEAGPLPPLSPARALLKDAGAKSTAAAAAAAANAAPLPAAATAAELRAECERRGLGAAGTKAELRVRLAAPAATKAPRSRWRLGVSVTESIQKKK